MSAAFVRQQLIAPLEPPRSERRRARPGCGSGCSAACSTRSLTLLSALVLAALIWPAIRFLLIDAVWDGSSRDDCLAETVGRPVGACWPFIAAKFAQFMYGFYPADQVWRVNLTYAIGARPAGAAADPARALQGAQRASCSSACFRCVAFFLLVGGVFGLPHVETRLWGGLLVTLVIAFTGIIGSLPLGILLALGRRSSLPLVRMVLRHLHRVLARRAADHGAVLRDLHAAVLPAGELEARSARRAC